MLLTMDGLRDLLLLLEPSLHGDFIVYQPFRNNYFDWLTRRLLRWLYLKTDLENQKREEEVVSATRIPLSKRLFLYTIFQPLLPISPSDPSRPPS